MDDSEVFLLHPESGSFRAGDPTETRGRLEQRPDVLDWLLLAGVAGVALFTAVTLSRMYQDHTAGGGLANRAPALMLGLLLLAVGGYLQWTRAREGRARLRLVAHGQVLRGAVLACRYTEGEPVTDEAGREVPAHRVEIDYRFESPTGGEITDRDEAIRTDLDGKTLPDKDDPVLVLYLDDRHYALL